MSTAAVSTLDDATPLDTHLEELEAVGLTGICTIAQAMALADVSRRTIYYWIDRGWIKVRYTPSKQLRVVVSTLQSRVPA